MRLPSTTSPAWPSRATACRSRRCSSWSTRRIERQLLDLRVEAARGPLEFKWASFVRFRFLRATAVFLLHCILITVFNLALADYTNRAHP